MTHVSDDWAYEQQDRHANPDPVRVKGLDGKTFFFKDRPLRCSWCQSVFYVYQPEDRPMPPYHNPDPVLINGNSPGQRYTCGHPRCWDVEQRHQLERGTDYQRAKNGYSTTSTPTSTPAPKTPRKVLQKFGGKP